MNCPSCGAQVETTLKGSQKICPYCGASLSDISADINHDPGPDSGLGYTPDPPEAYPPAKEDKRPAEESVDKKIVIDEKPVDIPVETLTTAIDAGRKISRYVIIGVAFLLALCTLCFILGSFSLR